MPLCNKPKNNISNEAIDAIHEYLLKKYGTSGKSTPWFPFFKCLNNLSIDTWLNDIVNSKKFFDDCKARIEELLLAMDNVKF